MISHTDSFLTDDLSHNFPHLLMVFHTLSGLSDISTAAPIPNNSPDIYCQMPHLQFSANLRPESVIQNNTS